MNSYLINIEAHGMVKLKIKTSKSQNHKIQVQKASTQKTSKIKLVLVYEEEEEEVEDTQLPRKKLNRLKNPTPNDRSESEDSSPDHMASKVL